jgi:hypothetical protein
VHESRSLHPNPVTKKEDASMLPTLPYRPGGRVPVKTKDGIPDGHGVPGPREHGNIPAGHGVPGQANIPAGPCLPGPMNDIGQIPDAPRGRYRWRPTTTSRDLQTRNRVLKRGSGKDILEHENPHLIPARRRRELLREVCESFNGLPLELPRDRNIRHTIRLQEEAYAPYKRNRQMSPKEVTLGKEYVGDPLKKWGLLSRATRHSVHPS